MGCTLLLYRASGQQGLEQKMTKTYTIAFTDSMLLATVPDGADIAAAVGTPFLRLAPPSPSGL